MLRLSWSKECLQAVETVEHCKVAESDGSGDSGHMMTREQGSMQFKSTAMSRPECTAFGTAAEGGMEHDVSTSHPSMWGNRGTR